MSDGMQQKKAGTGATDDLPPVFLIYNTDFLAQSTEETAEGPVDFPRSKSILFSDSRARRDMIRLKKLVWF